MSKLIFEKLSKNIEIDHHPITKLDAFLRFWSFTSWNKNRAIDETKDKKAKIGTWIETEAQRNVLELRETLY